VSAADLGARARLDAAFAGEERRACGAGAWTLAFLWVRSHPGVITDTDYFDPNYLSVLKYQYKIVGVPAWAARKHGLRHGRRHHQRRQPAASVHARAGFNDRGQRRAAGGRRA